MQQKGRAVEVTGSGRETGERRSRRRVLEGSSGSQFEKEGCRWDKEKVRRVRQEDRAKIVACRLKRKTQHVPKLA